MTTPIQMKKIGIFYGSSTGQTEMVAEKLHRMLGEENAELINVDIASKEDLENILFLFSVHRHGRGEMQDDWEDFSEIVAKQILKGKKLHFLDWATRIPTRQFR